MVLESFLNAYLQNKNYYLYPAIKDILEETILKEIEKEISEKFEEKFSTCKEKCQIGENDLYICSLIRSDSVEEFIVYYLCLTLVCFL